MKKPEKKPRGSALLSALFIMTLIAIAATAMSTRLQLDIYHTRMALMRDNMTEAANLVSLWAISALHDSHNALRREKMGVLLNYPIRYQPYSPEIKIDGSLIDLQSRFNLNNLMEKPYYLFFLNLLKRTSPQLSKSERDNIAQFTQHWISNYQLDRGEDKFMLAYLKQKPAYYPSQQPMNSVSEFRLVNGVDAKTYSQLEPFITALPQVLPINLNTASKTVLSALGDGLKENQVQELLTARGENGLLTLNKINKLLEKFNIRSNEITLTSQYFLVIAKVKTTDMNLTVYTILRRQPAKKGKFFISLVSRSINSL